jgi:SAM-dependent methyltransferase
MKKQLLEVVACPRCGGGFKLINEVVDARGNILSGSLTSACGAVYGVEKGLPILLSEEERASDVADSFGFEWETWHKGGFEDGTVFGRTIQEDVDSFFDGLKITETSLEAKLVLDGGCGSGALTVELARRYPQTTFIGIDVNASIVEIQRKADDLPNLHIVRGSIFALPFRDETFDFVWSNGVIHHTGDTLAAFESLTKVVKSKGRLYVWVYERKFSPFVGLRHMLAPFKVWDWSHKRLYSVCQFLSGLTWVAIQPLVWLAGIPGLKNNGRWKVISRNRSYKELTITWFDVLSPKYRDTYATREVKAWFEKRGFTELATTWWPVGVSGLRS